MDVQHNVWSILSSYSMVEFVVLILVFYKLYALKLVLILQTQSFVLCFTLPISPMPPAASPIPACLPWLQLISIHRWHSSLLFQEIIAWARQNKVPLGSPQLREGIQPIYL